MLRTAPLRSRVYVWALVGAATITSIWANALHAVRLNQQARHSDGLRLDDMTVGVLSAIAPLALADAVRGDDISDIAHEIVSWLKGRSRPRPTR
jgi:hypothetical protein